MDSSVTDRRIRPIIDAVAASNWKQALQLCEKWSKKGERSERFFVSTLKSVLLSRLRDMKALKAAVLVHQPDKTQHARGVSETISLCQREPPITDIDILQGLQDILKELNLRDEHGAKLWARACWARPNDQDLLMTWLEQSQAENDWLSAQKATMALRKAFPAERKYEFWNILMCFLIHNDEVVSDKERSTFGMLAYRFISKAAEVASGEPTSTPATAKAIKTPEELSLLTRVYLDSSNPREALKVMQSEPFNSLFRKSDPQVLLSSILDCLESACEPPMVFHYCKQFLRDPKYRDLDCVNDDRTWQLLFTAAEQAKESTVSDQLRELVNDFITHYPDSRRAQLAALELEKSHSSGPDSESPLLEACQTYHAKFKTTTQCFDDLRPFLAHLKPDAMERFLVSVKRPSFEVDSVNDLPSHASNLEAKESLLYLKLLLQFRLHHDHDNDKLLEFTGLSLKVYQRSLKANGPLPEACLLAAIALSQMSDSSDSLEIRPQAIQVQIMVLLRQCVNASEDFFPASLILIRLYLRMGSISLAMMAFKNLNIKNVQWETLGHLILNRISTLHPRQYGIVKPSENTAFNPAEALDLTIDVAANSRRLLTKGIMQGLNLGSYVNVADTVRLRLDLGRSLNTQIAVLEERRVRAIGGPLHEEELFLVKDILVDKREFSTFSILDTLGESWNDRLRGFPVQKKSWLTVAAFQDYLHQFLRRDSESDLAPAGDAISLLQDKLDEASVAIAEAPEQFTDAEKEVFDCQRALVQIIDPSRGKDPQRLLEESDLQLTTWLRDREASSVLTNKMGNLDVPDAHYLHTTFSYIHMFDLIKFWTTARIDPPGTRRARVSKVKKPESALERLRQFRDLAERCSRKAFEDAAHLKEQLNAPGVLGQLMDVLLQRGDDGGSGQIGSLIEGLCDAGTLENFCGELKESWEDALDGILALRPKVG